MPFSKKTASYVRSSRYGRVGNPKVFSNKKLTSKVKSILKKDGKRQAADIPASETGLSNSTITNGTSSFNYLSSSVFSSTSQAIENRMHYMDLYFKIVSSGTAGAVGRIIIGLDMSGSAASAASNILQDATQVASGYNATDCASSSEFRHVNRDIEFQHMVLKDISLNLVTNEPKLIKVRVPLHNRVERYDGVKWNFRPWTLLLSNIANLTVTCAGSMVHTDLQFA